MEVSLSEMSYIGYMMEKKERAVNDDLSLGYMSDIQMIIHCVIYIINIFFSKSHNRDHVKK